MNGIIMSHEISHSLQNSYKPSMIIKLDLSKSYDGLNQNYLLNVLDITPTHTF